LGEGPGKNEDGQGIPFCGRAGKLLTKMINISLGMEREDVFITNVVKCRPPDNRDPLPEEVESCRNYLNRQVDVLKPSVILVLGAVALKTLFDDQSLAIGRSRGIWRDYKGIPVMPSYHPAFLLRQFTEKNKDLVKKDLEMVKNKLKSEKIEI
tara:strand:- start:12237 stop:12695 length:459 start_codon:yes stop_codon:yes gene_type:complete